MLTLNFFANFSFGFKDFKLLLSLVQKIRVFKLMLLDSDLRLSNIKLKGFQNGALGSSSFDYYDMRTWVSV